VRKRDTVRFELAGKLRLGVVMRKPRIVGLPSQTSGSTRMRSSMQHRVVEH